MQHLPNTFAAAALQGNLHCCPYHALPHQLELHSMSDSNIAFTWKAEPSDVLQPLHLNPYTIRLHNLHYGAWL